MMPLWGYIDDEVVALLIWYVGINRWQADGVSAALAGQWNVVADL